MDFQSKRSVDDRLRSLIDRPDRAVKKQKPRRRKKNEYDIDVTRLDGLSESELVVIAQMAGYHKASRHLHRDDLINLILGEADDCLDVLAPAREMIYAYVKANERIMRSQMPCDLHCPTCPHHQVVECFTANRDLVE